MCFSAVISAAPSIGLQKGRHRVTVSLDLFWCKHLITYVPRALPIAAFHELRPSYEPREKAKAEKQMTKTEKREHLIPFEHKL